MGRRNSASNTMAAWLAATANAPFRASVKADAAWDTSLPHYGYATSMRVSPGGRLLLAFELEGIRDFFVAGHRTENGAQVEDDGANRATRQRPVTATPAPKTLDESFEQFRAARAALRAAEDAIEQTFLVEIDRLITANEIPAALALTNAIPSQSVLHTIAIEHLMKCEKWDSKKVPLWKAERAPYTAESARVLAVWIDAFLADDRAESAMGAFLQPLVEECVANKDRDGLTALIERTPGSVTRAFMFDARDYRIKDNATA